ncbi:hypothetical protein UFOVP929_29 [uncultured Caudovirales phage]|uniref:Uncharacterized protein n=1 Tax=uncultured Caudovirales phage TaxID=2100421 RepID=A0A6J5PS74_9CAUD|nr:hypothetical protein UFOVP929_29 [uncultured Caudovirales phage]
MRFVSRSANYTFIVRGETEYEVFETAEGTMIPRTIRKPPLIVEFKHGMAYPDESYAALMHWSGVPTSRTDPERIDSQGVGVANVFGAVPYQRGVAIQDGLGRIMGVSNAARPQYNFSLFDSEWFEDANDRKESEEALLKNSDNGLWYVKVGALEVEPPWPNYKQIRAKKGMTVAATIAAKCEEDGYSVAAVLAYEKAHDNRPIVVEALEALGTKEAVKAEEFKALEVEIS